MGFIQKLLGRRPDQAQEDSISPKVAEAVATLKANARKCVRLVSGVDGRSHLGGIPETTGEWPRYRGRPLCFVAQIELAEVQAATALAWLPLEGRLLFFYELECETWGHSAEDRGSWRVLYERSEAPACPEPDDLPDDARFAAVHIGVAEGISYAGVERTGLDLDHLSDASLVALNAALEELDPDAPWHQIGGYPSPIQSDTMESQCTALAGGIVSDWQLLLQLETDDEAGMMWGDAGTLYFWIREQDARARDFSKVWMILQCH